ncbi:MAG: DUF2256 domain-containing protein [Ignavibacteria bacterium]|nr:DUF2256 domain-containing protein [Ignavibacteria bacterium]
MHKIKKEICQLRFCIFCKKPFTWRKKWEKVWDQVKYCSDKMQ